MDIKYSALKKYHSDSTSPFAVKALNTLPIPTVLTITFCMFEFIMKLWHNVPGIVCLLQGCAVYNVGIGSTGHENSSFNPQSRIGSNQTKIPFLNNDILCLLSKTVTYRNSANFAHF